MKSIRVLAIAMAVALMAMGCKTPPEEPEIAPAEGTGPDQGWEMWNAPPLPLFDLAEPFVKLVDLARLRVGMTKDEVRAVFPDPLEVDLKSDDEIWLYGFAELIFRGDYLRDWFNK